MLIRIPLQSNLKRLSSLFIKSYTSQSSSQKIDYQIKLESEPKYFLIKKFIFNEYRSSNSIESKILDTSLLFVPEYGWSTKSISEACQLLGYTQVTHGLFPKGPVTLVEHFIGKCTGSLAESVHKDYPDFNS